MDVSVGTSVYTQFLNTRGGIEADVTITRISQQAFMVVTGHPSQIRDQHWIRSHADPDCTSKCSMRPRPMGCCQFTAQKPAEILQTISGDDLSNDAFPFGAAREIDIAHARGWAIRRSFLGELGYELMASTEFMAGIYEALIEAGRRHGLKHMGMFAMNACRLEKGFRHFGHDIGEDDTPYETGLGFAVNLEKPEFRAKMFWRHKRQEARRRVIAPCQSRYPA